MKSLQGTLSLKAIPTCDAADQTVRYVIIYIYIKLSFLFFSILFFTFFSLYMVKYI